MVCLLERQHVAAMVLLSDLGQDLVVNWLLLEYVHIYFNIYISIYMFKNDFKRVQRDFQMAKTELFYRLGVSEARWVT